MFYERREQTPREWMRRMKQSLMYITPQFDCRRMVREYMSAVVRAGAHAAPARGASGYYSLAREKARWNARIREVWDRVRFVEAAGPGAARRR